MSSLYLNWACTAPEIQTNIPANRMAVFAFFENGLVLLPTIFFLPFGGGGE